MSAAAVAALPATDLVSAPTDVTVGGRAAIRLGFIVLDDVGCDPGFIYAWDPPLGGAIWRTPEPGDTVVVWLVNVDGTVLVIAGETRANAGAGVQGEIEQIVTSIRFD